MCVKLLKIHPSSLVLVAPDLFIFYFGREKHQILLGSECPACWEGRYTLVPSSRLQVNTERNLLSSPLNKPICVGVGLAQPLGLLSLHESFPFKLKIIHLFLLAPHSDIFLPCSLGESYLWESALCGEEECPLLTLPGASSDRGDQTPAEVPDSEDEES